ncbi:MAG: sensor histidine kinase [Bacteroidetes bacterium]|nr:sensor histidine kinase [Bacteroidota bacterium]
MKFRILIIFAQFFFYTHLDAQQSATDSLEKTLLYKELVDSSKLKILYQLSREYTFNAPEKALESIEKTISLAQKLKKTKTVADALSLKGKVLKNNGDFARAIEVHLEALKMKESINDVLGQSISNNDIGVVYKSMKNYTEAMKYYRKSNQLANQANFGKGIANTLNNIGTSFFELRIIDSAIVYYNKALTKSEEIDDPACLATSYNNLGTIYGYKDAPQIALGYYLKCLEIDKSGSDSYGMILSMLNIGESYKEMKQFSKALEYFSQAEKICIENEAKPLLKDAYHSIGDCYEKMKEFDMAYFYLDKYSSLKDSLLNDESTQQIAEMQTKFEAQKKDLQIKNQIAELAVNKADAARKRILIYFLIGAALLTLVISYLLYNRYKLKQQALLDFEILKQQEIRSKAIIEAEENERRRIAQDLHDGIGQILSAAKLNLSGLEDKISLESLEARSQFKNAMDLVDESVKEIRTVSHNMMPNALLKLGLVAAVREFVQKLNTGEKVKIDLEVNGLNERLEPTTEAVLFRVLQEIVSNVIKHAKANQVSMQLIRHDTELTAMVEDNGVGFDTRKLNDFEGIGLKNIQSRIAYLKGKVHFDSTLGKGTTVVIEIPI